MTSDGPVTQPDNQARGETLLEMVKLRSSLSKRLKESCILTEISSVDG